MEDVIITVVEQYVIMSFIIGFAVGYAVRAVIGLYKDVGDYLASDKEGKL